MQRLAVTLVILAILAGAALHHSMQGIAGAAPRPDVVDVKSSLAGVVLADDLVEVDARVEDAQPLLYVRTRLNGLKSIAARAPREGVVGEVLVRPGQRVERGDIVVRLVPR